MAKLIPDDSLYAKIAEENLKHISCICHKTKFENLRSIFELGRLPGGISSTNNHAHINFTPFPPFDARNLAAGRRGKELDVVIVFKPEAMLKYNMGLSQNAILATSCNIPWTTIELIYVIPPAYSGHPWVLYSPGLIDRKIQGHTSATTGNNVDSPAAGQEVLAQSSTGDCGWRKCPNCKAVNPKGFTSCFSCRVWFTFEPIAKLSKVALRFDGKGDNAGVPRTIATDTSTKGKYDARSGRRGVYQNCEVAGESRYVRVSLGAS